MVWGDSPSISFSIFPDFVVPALSVVLGDGFELGVCCEVSAGFSAVVPESVHVAVLLRGVGGFLGSFGFTGASSAAAFLAYCVEPYHDFLQDGF